MAVLVLLAATAGDVGADTGSSAATTGTRLQGLRIGPHAVGFTTRTLLDPTRHASANVAGRRIGLATWYPAQPGRGIALTYLDYRQLAVGRLGRAGGSAIEDDEVDMLVGWRHAGVVPLTPDQAAASLRTGGIARRGLTALPGRWPVIVVLGGPYYLATTAELLATHGFVVVAPFEYDDLIDELAPRDFKAYMEDDLRDAQVVLAEIAGRADVDVHSITTLGHGGGGMSALLLAMRDRRVTAVAAIDAGIFSTRSQPTTIAFYDPRRLRVPFLNLLTRDTRNGQDLYADVESMRFSRRTEVVLEDAALRHHDLSDIGRAVTAPLAIRGGAQDAVQATYAEVAETLLRFVRSGTPDATSTQARREFERWVAGDHGVRRTVRTLDEVAPAPAFTSVLLSLGPQTVAELRAAWARDPEGDVFQAESLARLIDRAVRVAPPETAAALAAFAVAIRPAEPALQLGRSRAAEANGDRTTALASASVCAGVSPGDDWRLGIIVRRCRERVERLGHDSR